MNRLVLSIEDHEVLNENILINTAPLTMMFSISKGVVVLYMKRVSKAIIGYLLNIIFSLCALTYAVLVGCTTTFCEPC